MARINQAGFNPVQNQPTAEAEQAGRKGEVVQSRGQQIQTAPDQASLAQKALADSAEEVSMMFQDKSADRLKKRDAKSRAGSRIKEAMAKYLKSVKGVGSAERFEKLHSALKQLKNPTQEQVKQMLQGFREGTGEEGIDADLLLALEELFSAEGADDELLEVLRDLKSDLGEDLQSFYKDTIKTTSDMGQVYDQMLGEYGETEFMEATDTLMTKLGEDLQAEGSSVDPAKIKATVDALFNLQVARNTFSAFAKLFQRMESAFADEDHSWQKDEDSRNKQEREQNPEDDCE